MQICDVLVAVAIVVANVPQKAIFTMASFDYNYHNSVCFLFIFKFCIPSGVKITIALINMRQAKPEGFWYL